MSESKENKTLKEQVSALLGDHGYVKQEWEGRAVDQLLQWLVNHTNVNIENKHDITLTVGGNLISGLLISSSSYLDKFSEELSRQFTSENGSSDLMREQVLSWKIEPEAADGDLPPSQFIHLEDARVYSSSGGPILNGGSLWRGKISSVDGFSLHGIVQANS